MMFCWGTQVVKDVLLKQTCERMFSWSRHRWKDIWYSRHVKGHLMKEYKYDPTDSGRQALSIGLVCSTLLFFDNGTHVLVHLTQLSSTCGTTAIERNSSKNCSWGSCSSLPLLWPCLRQVGGSGSSFRIKLQLLDRDWCLPAERTGLKLLVCMWCLLLYWSADTLTTKIGLAPKELFLNRSTSLMP